MCEMDMRYSNPDLYDPIYECLLIAMTAEQAVDACASFLFMGDLNDDHQKWLGSITTNRQGVAAPDFATVSGCNQLHGDWPNSCTWRNSSHLDDRCSCSSTGGCCSTGLGSSDQHSLLSTAKLTSGSIQLRDWMCIYLCELSVLFRLR